MTESITRCPKCKTSFRVNEEHLKTARGAVRCGSCLNIFNAKEHLVGAPASSGEASTPAPSQKSDDDDDMLISDDMPLEEDEPSAQKPLIEETLDSNVFIAKTASKTEINLFERRIKDAEDHDREHTEADESWALNLLEDDKKETKRDTSNLKLDIEKSTPRTDTEEHDNEEQYNTENELENDQEAFKSVFQVLEDDNDRTESGLEPFPDALIERDEYEYDSQADTDYLDDHDEFSSTNGTDFFESFEPEPLELHIKDSVRVWQTPQFWMGMSVLAFFTLIAQVMTYNFDDWGRQQQFRPYYAHICKITGCSLPILQDLNQIKIDNMVVIDHPKSPDMLLVDATLQNRAKFDQYFPTLMLTFTDLNNTLVKRFVFKPKDYVGGELAGKKFMPAKHPIHITLEISDPGEDAVNYQISIVKP